MADNRSDDYRANDSIQDDVIGRNKNNAQENNSEKNVTEMNTEDKRMEVRTIIDCSDSIMSAEDEQMDALLDELLHEIAQADAQVTAPLEAQAAWRKAIRAEAAAQDENASKNNAKIIRMNRWMRSVGSIAAALVVLFAGTYGARLEDTSSALPENAAAQYASYGSDQQAQNSSDQWDDQGSGISVSAVGYTPVNNAALRSDGADDQTDPSVGVQTAANTPEVTSQTTEKQQDANGGADIAQPIVIRSAERSIQSMEYERDVQWMSDLVSEYDAYYEEKSEIAADSQTGRVSTMVIRVPVERLDDFLMEMDQLGTTVLRSEKAEEITGRYMDTQSRLDALYQQKSKLDDMMKNAQNVQDIIAIDAQLTQVAAEIERLEGDMRRWQSQQSYSTVKVTLTEVFEQPLAAEASMSERMKAGFDESILWLSEFGRDALVVLVSCLPRLVVFVPAAVLLGVLIWALARRKKN